jgi:hypothetical protein
VARKKEKENWLATFKGNRLPLYTLKHIQTLKGNTQRKHSKETLKGNSPTIYFG